MAESRRMKATPAKLIFLCGKMAPGQSTPSRELARREQAVLLVQRQVRPVPTAVLTFVAGALGCMFVLRVFIASTGSTFEMCP
jgi:hypothetical protein